MKRPFNLEFSNEEVDQLEAKAKRLGLSQAEVIERMVKQALVVDAQNVAAHGPTAVPK